MCFHVASVIVYFIESFSADMAVMRKVSYMQLHVAVQLTFCGVSFITQSAGKVVAIVRAHEDVSSCLWFILNTRNRRGYHYFAVQKEYDQTN